MKTLNSPVKFMVYCISKAVKHPRTPIYYYVCECGCRFPNSAEECPQCGDKTDHSPDHKQESPIPWYGSVGVLLIGVGVCVTGACCGLPTLDRVGDALVYIPLGNIFGMTIRRG